MTKRAKAAAALVLLALSAGPAVAGEAGGEALHRTAVDVRNRSGRPIACVAQIAHWFSAELGRAMPDEALRAELWSDPASGAVFLLNAAGDRLPVEAAWCGFAGEAWATRSPLTLARRHGEAAADVRVSCDAAGDHRLRCR
ncbi:hypothetical protein [Azospirillum sp. ST 5-10]|uniref:hypothetical protein n=1 Tax=unclassified Azospirillum TaxID=2630922 RepID=UPI003F49D0D1